MNLTKSYTKHQANSIREYLLAHDFHVPDVPEVPMQNSYNFPTGRLNFTLTYVVGSDSADIYAQISGPVDSVQQFERKNNLNGITIQDSRVHNEQEPSYAAPRIKVNQQSIEALLRQGL